MKVEWQEIDGEQYFNDPMHGWLKRLRRLEVIPDTALSTMVDEPEDKFDPTLCPGTVYDIRQLDYAIPCDPPCTLTPQVSLDVCLEYVSYKVSKATKGMQPEVKEVFLQKVYALKQTFALEVEKLLGEVKHG